MPTELTQAIPVIATDAPVARHRWIGDEAGEVA